ncbi:MAG TPA: YdcF family protein [Candidatus Acidoferrum sp.]|jgi:uncharacterized SAM-binding protein YcdF (DUF218 family)
MSEHLARMFFTRRFLMTAGIGISLLALAGSYAFSHAGYWLVREDPLQKSQAILVLSGGLPDRAIAAAQIYRAGYAKEVWLTKPLQPGASMQELHLPYAGEEQYSRMVLIDKGVPTSNIRILQPAILNTVDELRVLAATLDQQPGATIIVVTSKAHTRRVRLLWRKISKSHTGRMLVRAAPDDPFDEQHWWRTTNDALNVVREYLGLLNAWAGLPLTHAK